MAVLVYDETIGAFKEAAPPMIWSMQKVQVTLTVNSAANDTVNIKDIDGRSIGTCATDTTGVGTVQINIIPSLEYTFVSSVATDTTDSTKYFSKTVVLNGTNQSIAVMPDFTLYWHGNQCTWLTGGYSVSTDDTSSDVLYTPYLQWRPNNTGYCGFRVTNKVSFASVVGKTLYADLLVSAGVYGLDSGTFLVGSSPFTTGSTKIIAAAQQTGDLRVSGSISASWNNYFWFYNTSQGGLQKIYRIWAQ